MTLRKKNGKRRIFAALQSGRWRLKTLDRIVLRVGITALLFCILLTSLESYYNDQVILALASKIDSKHNNEIHIGNQETSEGTSPKASARSESYDNTRIISAGTSRLGKNGPRTTALKSPVKNDVPGPPQSTKNKKQEKPSPSGDKGWSNSNTFLTSNKNLEEGKTTMSELSASDQPHYRACSRVIAGGKLQFMIERFAKYIPVNAELVQTRHDHNFCLFRRPRQICADDDPKLRPQGFPSLPAAWKMVIETPSITINSDNSIEHQRQVCDLPEFAQELQGPKGIARHLLERERKQQVYHVLLMGDSRLQRVWEALVCEWTQDVTRITLHVIGQQASGTSAVGTLLQTIQNHVQTHGCAANHPTQNHRTDFDEKAKVPPASLLNCDDGIAMVEFDHSIRFYFIDRPDLHLSNLQNVIIELGITLDKVDQLVFNQDYHKVLLNREWNNKFREGVWDSQIQWNPEVLHQMQRRDVDRWLGVENSEIVKTMDDERGCITGVPDDGPALLLLMLLQHKVPTRTTSIDVPRLAVLPGRD